MAWTYDSSLRAHKDQVRFLIQDNNTSRQLFQDEEIDWVVRTEANVYMAASVLCNQLVVKAGGGIKSKKISEFAITYDVEFYRGLATNLMSRGSGHQIPYMGGISIADKQRQQQDSDAVTPAFAKNLDDNPAAPSPQTPPTNPLTTI